MKKFTLIPLTIFTLVFSLCFSPLKGQSGNPFLYIEVDELPLFDKGNSTLKSFINQHLSWPVGFDGQGSVLVSFVVKKDGSTSSFKIERSLCQQCDEEVRNLFSLMPDWSPGIKDGVAGDVLMFLPVCFVIN